MGSGKSAFQGVISTPLSSKSTGSLSESSCFEGAGPETHSGVMMPKNCFVVGPIGDEGRPARGHADWLLDEIITPVFTEHFKDFEVIRSDRIAQPGMIDSQVINHLLDADLVIADLSLLNANAFYEI